MNTAVMQISERFNDASSIETGSVVVEVISEINGKYSYNDHDIEENQRYK